MTNATELTASERKWRRIVSALLFFGLFVLYHANTSVLDEGDAVPTANVPVALLTTGRLSFDPEHFPELFKWKSHPPLWERDDYFVMHWKERLFDKTAADFFREHVLEYVGPRYYIVESPKHPGVFVSTFGPVPAIFTLPPVAVFHAIDPDFWGKMSLRASVAKLSSAALVSATAVLLFWIALRFVGFRNKWRALLLALVYALATCAWAVSSQNMWQQTVNQFLLTWGFFHFLGKDRRAHVILAGVLFGAATSCRSTGVFPIAALSVFLFREDRKNLVPFLIGLLPFPILVGFYNYYYFGNPLTFAQELVGHAIAIEKTGSPRLFSTPIWRGFTGLMFSPSRGLLIFSPILVPAFWGAYEAWKKDAFRILRPLTLSTAVVMGLQCMWFDWWGGHAFGYRPWLDVVPNLVLFLLPIADRLTATHATRAACALAFAWSVFVQAVGAFSYDRSWNLRVMQVVRVPNRAAPLTFVDEQEARRYADAHGGQFLGATYCDVDLKYCRHRLWSWKDNLLGYQLAYFKEARARRLPMGWHKLGDKEVSQDP